MSATAKALMAFHERRFGARFGGDVWIPEEVYEKLVELARREVTAEKKLQAFPTPGGSR